jgi:hypothetical protein
MEYASTRHLRFHHANLLVLPSQPKRVYDRYEVLDFTALGDLHGLILTRKIGESLMIGVEVTMTVIGGKGNQVRIGIEAPKDVEVA